MARIIKRYESRKLYDPQESRYVSLAELADWIRDGAEIEVVDNATDEVVTEQTLTQIILEDRRNGKSRLSVDTLHELVRAGGERLSEGVTQVQKGFDRFVRTSIERLPPMREARDEMGLLRERLDELEHALQKIEEGVPEGASGAKSDRKRTPAGGSAAKKAAARKPSKGKQESSSGAAGKSGTDDKETR